MSTIPSWAISMIGNYRQFYKDKYGTDSKLTDAAIWNICNTVFDDESNKNQDNERVSEMFLEEHRLNT